MEGTVDRIRERKRTYSHFSAARSKTCAIGWLPSSRSRLQRRAPIALLSGRCLRTMHTRHAQTVAHGCCPNFFQLLGAAVAEWPCYSAANHSAKVFLADWRQTNGCTWSQTWSARACAARLESVAAWRRGPSRGAEMSFYLTSYPWRLGTPKVPCPWCLQLGPDTRPESLCDGRGRSARRDTPTNVHSARVGPTLQLEEMRTAGT